MIEVNIFGETMIVDQDSIQMLMDQCENLKYGIEEYWKSLDETEMIDVQDMNEFNTLAQELTNEESYE
jgi:hypothetical protein